MNLIRQRGMTLLEVLMALVVLSLGVFSTAALQVRALQMTDDALRGSQAAWQSSGVFERTLAPAQ
ncbi:hypothetical protein PS627_02189 [Pseudomonas fluorescens]|uniref:type IV pilus modification PilV family protein n=1 Tax=Pseudomonas fluorescens TaxID=294 RepID=UPI00125616FB|nr:prepilin-type N-terminal cleavage/methylation domain-containing protein [Pseudomonas fluorescens]CAG8866917.1 hypothetical protein PS627_02189 [Pseudomonas fluorescens]VVP78888.1 hypothetical protein PS910_01779 [Pseudomonas fluorescens]